MDETPTPANVPHSSSTKPVRESPLAKGQRPGDLGRRGNLCREDEAGLEISMVPPWVALPSRRMYLSSLVRSPKGLFMCGHKDPLRL